MPKLYAFKSITMKHNKPLTYKRFRAYLRIQLKNKSCSKKRIYLIIFFYFLISLSVLFLPLDVLSKYPFLKYFTDFMDFIPAIKLMETKTYAPELCKFYASYMLIITFICLICLIREFAIFALISVLYPNKPKYKTNRHKAREQILANPKFCLFFLIVFIPYGIYTCFQILLGEFVSFNRYVNSDEYFIYNISDIIIHYYINFGLMFLVGVPFMYVMGSIVIGDILIQNWSKIQWLKKKKI